jgi:hypothetical protein
LTPKEHPVKCTRVVEVGLWCLLSVSASAALAASESPPAEGPQPIWDKVWDRQPVEATIRSRIAAVNAARMTKHLFHLAKDPLPFRKLNFTLPGHAKDTLHEADDYLAGKLESGGYRVEREGVRVQAFRRDTGKPLHAQYSRPLPEDPWYTADNLYAEKKGRSRPGEIILLLAHKDSQSWIDSPGANDNAIGTVGVLEAAGVLAEYPSERTIRFLFCNEEHIPWTSVTAAQKAKARGDNIVAVFNLDGIGAKPAEQTAAGRKTNVTAYTEPAGERLAELMQAASARFAIGLEQRAVKRPSPGDDDGSFVRAGYPAAVVNIGSWPYGDPHYHGEGDIPERCDVTNAAQTVQATLAAVLTLDLQPIAATGGGASRASGTEDSVRGTATVPSDLPAATARPDSPPEALDLRPAFTEWGLKTRVQGPRGTCSAFVVTEAIEYAVASRQGRVERLSVEFLNWASNQATRTAADGGFFSDLWKGCEKFGVCPEQDLPYSDRFDPALQPSEQALAQAKRIRELGLEWHWIKEWDPHRGLSSEQLAEVKRTLQQRWPVCGGFLWPKQERWENGVLQLCPRRAVRDGHSVLLVGWRDDPAQPGGGVFLIRNTAGPSREGWLPYEYLQKYMNDAAWVGVRGR